MNLRKSRILLAIVCGTIAAVASGSAENPLRVKTDNGVVEGKREPDGKVITFLGIPYAAPPTGELRWKPPQAPAKWLGARSAVRFGAHCPQFESNSDVVFRDPGASEDCLTLNVWAPANATQKSLPVMVWIHGGGFAYGGSSEPRQDGKYLAERRVVVVSMNYRLGILGFLAHSELTAESPRHASGNYGLMDITAALEWVRRNIASFGGDSENVTLFGESAGSFAVSALMASPHSHRLFAKAIGESGGAFFSPGLVMQSRSEREERDRNFLKATFGKSGIADLRQLPVEVLIQKVIGSTAPVVFGPDVDGDFLPDSVPNLYAAGRQAHIPLLAGWTADEGRNQIVCADSSVTASSFAIQAQRDFGAGAAEFLSLYPASTSEELQNSASDYAGDHSIAYSTWKWLEAQVNTGHSFAYRYLFELGSPGDDHHPANLGAFHTDDIEYVFGTLDARPRTSWRPEDRELSDRMMSYWTNFARTGDPNGPNLTPWPTYSGKSGWEVMHLDAAQKVAPDVHRDRYLFLDKAWDKASYTAKTKP
jgi:para-nitrobenzyl esterase